jgi:hypothetical protein
VRAEVDLGPRNKRLAQQLIDEGRMHPAGRAAVDAAKADGRSGTRRIRPVTAFHSWPDAAEFAAPPWPHRRFHPSY